MVLVERYVEAVRKQLLRSQRDDIAAELRETLRSQIEEAEAEQGRPPTDVEIAEILTRYGAPEVVAARYGARTHLIGPDVFPHYRGVLKIVLSILGAVLLIALVATATMADNPRPAMWRVVWTVAVVALAHFTVITLLFARVDRMRGAGTAERWDPRELLLKGAPRTSIPRAEALASLLATTFGLLWWMDVLPINRWLVWERLPLGPAPIWDDLSPLILTLLAVNLAVSAVALLRSHWVQAYDAASILIDAGIAVVLYQALRAPALIVATDPAAPLAGLASQLQVVITISLMVWVVIVIGSIAVTVRRWITPATHAAHG